MAKRNGHHWHQYVFPIENIHISLTGMSHQMVFHILRSHFFFARILKLYDSASA